jgi:hypothetical protein
MVVCDVVDMARLSRRKCFWNMVAQAAIILVSSGPLQPQRGDPEGHIMVANCDWTEVQRLGIQTMRILVGVTNCHKAVYPEALSRKEPPNNSLCVKAARDTWIKDATSAGIDVKFFFGRYNDPPGTALVPQDDEVFLDCDDSYDGLVDKVTAMCAWAFTHGYDYFMKVDVDSYVHVQNLIKAMVEFSKWDYVGRGWGLGYLLSRAAMKIVMEERQKRSWAEDSHVLRTLFAYADKGNKVTMYSDGRFVFLPNLLNKDVLLYDTAFLVVNPMTPEGMHILNESPSIEALMPLSFSKEDLWATGENRVEHSIVHNAFAIKGETLPWSYDEWVELDTYHRQPAKDWSDVIFAALDVDAVADAPSFKEWLGIVPDRKILLAACRARNVESNRKLAEASKTFKNRQ